MRYLLSGILGLLVLSFFYACQKEVSVEYGTPAKGSLQSSGGDCLPKLVGGSYVEAKALNDSNFIEVTVNVTAAGPYTIYTDTLNGYAFKATGTFARTGTNTVRLKGSGKPVNAGTDDFTVVFDTTYCLVSVDVQVAGSSGGTAAFTLGGAPTTCAPFSPFGNYIKDTVLDGRHYVKVDVNVTTPGAYTISTNTVNGYSFSASGTFGATGTQTVNLMGTGKPLAAGTNAFTVTAGASSCTFSITVTATAPTGCSPVVQGTFTAGTAVTAANKVVLTHTYATAGPYTVSTNTVNGYSFGPSTITATAGSNTITLNATGTPTAAGTNNFTVDFGDGQNCSFSVTTVSGTPVLGTDYFPTTQNSYWTYFDDSGVDTFKVTVSGTQTYGSNTYQKFNYTGIYSGTEYYRKDAAGFYYQSFDTSGWGASGVTFSQPRYELNFLKNALTTGAKWNQDVAANFSGTPVTLRFSFECKDANATTSVNGKTFTNVYKVSQELLVGAGGPFSPVDGPYNYYYARGIGLIYAEDASGTPVVPFQSIRFWQVN